MARTRSVRRRPFRRLCEEEQTRSWQGRMGEDDPLRSLPPAENGGGPGLRLRKGIKLKRAAVHSDPSLIRRPQKGRIRAP